VLQMIEGAICNRGNGPIRIEGAICNCGNGPITIDGVTDDRRNVPITIDIYPTWRRRMMPSMTWALKLEPLPFMRVIRLSNTSSIRLYRSRSSWLLNSKYLIITSRSGSLTRGFLMASSSWVRLQITTLCTFYTFCRASAKQNKK